MPTKLFPKEELRNVINHDSEDLENISDEPIDTSRWEVHYDLVFRDLSDNRLYQISYSCGATEIQDTMPFEFDPDMIECVEVEKVQIVVDSYKPVD